MEVAVTLLLALAFAAVAVDGRKCLEPAHRDYCVSDEKYLAEMPLAPRPFPVDLDIEVNVRFGWFINRV